MADERKQLDDVVRELNNSQQRISRLQNVLKVLQSDLVKTKEEIEVLHAFVDNMPNSIYIKDTLGQHILVNIVDAKLKGLTRVEDAIGKTDFDFYPFEIAVQFFNDEQEIIRTGRPLIDREEALIDQTTGQIKWFSTTKAPWIIDNRIEGIIGIGRDITDTRSIRMTIPELFRAISSGKQSILDVTVDKAVELLGAKSGGLYHFDARSNLLFLVASKHRPNQQLGLTVKVTEGVAGSLFQSGKDHLYVPNYNQWSESIPRHIATGTLGAVLAVLLKVNEEKIGVLYVNDETDRPYSGRDIELLKLFGAQAAIAIQTIKPYEETNQVVPDLSFSDREAFEQVAADYRNMAEFIVNAAMSRLNGDGGKVYLLDETRQNLRLIAVEGQLKNVFRLGSLLPITEGVAGELLRQKAPFIIENNYKSYKYRIERLVPYVNAVIEAPLVLNNETIGVVGVFADGEARRFSDQDAKELIDFSQRAVELLSNVGRVESSQRYIRRLEIINEIVRVVAVSEDPDEILSVIVQQIATKLNCTHCTIFLAEERQGKKLLVPRKTHSTIPGYEVERIFQEGEGITGLVYKNEKPIRLIDATKEEIFAAPTRNIDKPRSMVATPIKVKDRTIGVIIADQDEAGWFSEDDLDLLTEVAEHAAITIAIKNAGISLATQNPTRDLVFISYSHEDTIWMQQILRQLQPLQMKGIVFVDQHNIQTGERWDEKIKNGLRQTRLAVLLVSPEFAASEYIVKTELPPIFEAEKKGELRIVWIAVKLCTDQLYKQLGVNQFQAAINPKKPLNGYSGRKLDAEIVKICNKIMELYDA